MSIDRKEIIDNERKAIFAKPIVAANPAFDLQQIDDFFTLFNLYADTRRQADVREIVTTARTLGYDKTQEFIYKGLVSIADALDGEWVGFEQFLTLLTEVIVSD
jgi:Ca2+-binding EF-hand superfamily protein